jgi:protein tyrosine phosphatase (PTP) superfamily phosphohydrolase (DUF442 family)
VPGSAGLGLLDNLPKLEPPEDLAPSAVPPPATEIPPRAQVAPAPEPPVPAPPAPEANSNTPLTPTPAAVSVAPGIHHFSAVELRLAGGSLPNSQGLEWLAEKGYKTLLDLRESGEVQPSFLAEVQKNHLRYVSLPVTLKTVNTESLNRFNLELAMAEQRPLYFCDTDGNRAGALWFVRRIQVDHVDLQTARREAQDLGLADETFLRAAETCVESLKSQPSAPAAAPAQDPFKPQAPKAPEPAPSPVAPAPSSTPAPSTPQTGSAETFPREFAATTAGEKTPDLPPTTTGSAHWKSYTAMVVTGLGLPLAFLSRASAPIKTWVLASLPSTARSQRSLPDESGG